MEASYQSNYLWQTPQTSLIKYDGLFTTVFEVNDDIEFKTRDGEVFCVSI
jgi:hypothetical protein